MSSFFDDNCPSKRAKPGQTSHGAASPDGFKIVGEVFPGRLCPEDNKDLLKRYTNGRLFVVCLGNIKDDPSTCQFTANCFGKDRVKPGEESKIACIFCTVLVEHTLSLGRSTGRTDPVTGKLIYQNVHVYFDTCWGKKRAFDPKTNKEVLSHFTTAPASLVGV
ncbi:unnamed protein product [Ectocarpus sp. CCAP 1310/34]|nr:unnamed protein product [Ectocarpus sp. CCAP 1310/34]